MIRFILFVGAALLIVVLFLWWLVQRQRVKRKASAYVRLYPPEGDPSTDGLRLCYEVPAEQWVHFSIVDRDGHLQRLLFEGRQERGIYPVNIDTTPFSNGDYYCQLKSQGRSISKKFRIQRNEVSPSH